MNRMVAIVRHPALASAVLALAVGAPAEDKPDQVKKQFFDTVQVNLISVEVFVTGRDGKPLTGLQREDFEVFEDGHPVKITNFFAAEPSAPAPTPAPAAASGVEAAPGEVDIPPVEQRLTLVVLADNSGITGAERKMALRHARDALASCLKLSHTQAMVVTLDTHAHIRQGFTSDPKLLAAALDKIETESTDPNSGGVNNAMIERAMSRISVPSSAGDAMTPALGRRTENVDFNREDAHAILETIRSNAEADHERTRVLLRSLEAFNGSLAGLPGRKVVFYVGNGLNLRPGEAMFMEWGSRFGNSGIEPGFSAPQEADRLSLSSTFRELVTRANADRVTFYAIDAGGRSAVHGPSAEQALLDPEPGANMTETMGKQGSMQYLTYATGGTTISSTPRASDALAKSLRDFDTYYSLAYAAPRIGDGRSHSISVKVHRDGAVARHRQNYLDKTADDRVRERNLSALLHDSGVNSLEIEVAVGASMAQKDGSFTVPLVVTVPIGRLALLPDGDAHRGSVSIFLAAKDLDDRITPPIKRQFPISIPNEKLFTALGQAASYTFMVLMARGPQTVAVSVRDDVAQLESTVTARFTVSERGTKATTQDRHM